MWIGRVGQGVEVLWLDAGRVWIGRGRREGLSGERESHRVRARVYKGNVELWACGQGMRIAVGASRLGRGQGWALWCRCVRAQVGGRGREIGWIGVGCGVIVEYIREGLRVSLFRVIARISVRISLRLATCIARPRWVGRPRALMRHVWLWAGRGGAVDWERWGCGL